MTLVRTTHLWGMDALWVIPIPGVPEKAERRIFSTLRSESATVQWDSAKHDMKGHSRHNSSLIGRKNQAKVENDCVLRNGHRIKITQPNSMIFVSFSSVEDALFSSQSTENRPFRFFLGHPVYTASFIPQLEMVHR